MTTSNGLLHHVIARFRPLSNIEKTFCHTESLRKNNLEVEQNVRQSLGTQINFPEQNKIELNPGSVVLVRVESTEHQSYFDDAVVTVLIMGESASVNGALDGFMMSTESVYAGEWDLILGEVGETINRWAECIQTWNKVHLKKSQVIREIGRLNSEQMQIIESNIQKLIDRKQKHEFIAIRVDEVELDFKTGTPVVSNRDPRFLYQFLYHELSIAISMTAKHSDWYSVCYHSEQMKSPPFGGDFYYLLSFG